MKIRHIEITNFRGINHLEWQPSEGVNCLIGSGDSCKSTILDAIDLALGARRQANFSDSDFHLYRINQPIVIDITLGDLNPDLLNMEAYGFFHRGYDCSSNSFFPEPTTNSEIVLTVRLTVREDLDPQWMLFSERALADGRERNLLWKHRLELAPVRLGTDTRYHTAWGNRSILNKLSEDKAVAASALANAARQARQTFAEGGCEGVDDVLKLSKSVANSLGIPIADVFALLDMKGASFSGGAIALHDERHIPLRSLGTGSSRLLVSGLQRYAGISPITIIDEIEHGLEPYRIVRLLHSLGAKANPAPAQSFMTSHSPFVLRELSSGQLNIVRCLKNEIPQGNDENGNPRPTVTQVSNAVIWLGDGEDEQKLLRSNAEAFLTPNVIVCEGKTEIGLLKGVDDYFTSTGSHSILAHGSYWADGNGDPSLFERALTFARLGYRTSIFMDSDKETAPEMLSRIQQANISIIRWQAGFSTEMAVISNTPAAQIPLLLNIAAEWRSAEAIDSHIRHASSNAFSLVDCLNSFDEAMRAVLVQCAGERKWFKDVTPAENLGRQIAGPNWQSYGDGPANVFQQIWQWVQTAPSAVVTPPQPEA